MSTTGNDGTGDGSIGSPWKTIEHSSSMLSAGDTLYIRGGTHRSAKADTIVNRFYINNMNGSSGNIITITNYPGETVIFNLDDVYVPGTAGDGPTGMKIENSSWFRLNGIRITGLNQNPANINSPCGFIVYDSDDWTIERMEIDNIQGYGFYVQGTKNPGGIGCHRGLVLNCDVHDVGDVYSGWGGANGFQCTGADLSTDITFRGCRAWRCSDDGFDLYSVDGTFRYENCWSFWNGYQPNVTPLTIAGDGMGFKLGPNNSDMSGSVTRYLSNCLAFENRRFGFDQNVSGSPTTQFHVFNCTAYDNKGGNNYFFGGNTSINQTFKNNISYVGGVNGSEITSGPNVSNNSWNGGVTLTGADFVSLDSTGMDGARQVDGSLPVLNFLKIASGSDLIDAGVNVGLSYTGAAPDLGAFEFGAGGNSSPTANAGTDQSITLPTSSVTLTGSGSDSDGTIASYAWSQISGTSATIASPTSATTNVTGLSTAGTRVFRLTVTDNLGATGTDDISISVSSALSSSSNAKFLKMSGVLSGSRRRAAPDVNVTYVSGASYTQTGTQWYSVDGSADFKLYNAGYLPASQLGYYYADYIGNPAGSYEEQEWTKGSSLMFCSSNAEIPLNDWDTPILYAVHPHEGSAFYRVWDSVSGFNTTAVTYQNGDKYGLFRAVDGTITAQYYRSGSWTVLHTFSTTNTSNLYLTAKGFGWSHINTPKASPNLV
jgi:hypothetical protein